MGRKGGAAFEGSSDEGVGGERDPEAAGVGGLGDVAAGNDRVCKGGDCPPEVARLEEGGVAGSGMAQNRTKMKSQRVRSQRSTEVFLTTEKTEDAEEERRKTACKNDF